MVLLQRLFILLQHRVQHPALFPRGEQIRIERRRVDLRQAQFMDRMLQRPNNAGTGSQLRPALVRKLGLNGMPDGADESFLFRRCEELELQLAERRLGEFSDPVPERSEDWRFLLWICSFELSQPRLACGEGWTDQVAWLS